MAWSKMVDLRYSDEEKTARMPSMPFDMPRPASDSFPSGTMIVLDKRTMELLDLDCDCDEGDIIHMMCFGVVRTVRKESGQETVSIQIEKIQIEDETDEAPGDDKEEEEEE